MGWPQITYLILVAISFGLEWANHGKPKEGTRSVWTYLIGVAIVLPLLWFGGFFG